MQVLDVAFEDVLHIKDTIDQREMAMPSGLAVNTVQRRQVLLILGYTGIRHDLQESFGFWISLQSFTPGGISGDARSHSARSKGGYHQHSRRGALKRWVENLESFRLDVLQTHQ